MQHLEPVMVGDVNLEDVNTFEYLGSKIGNSGGTDTDVKARICKTRSAFVSLKKIWNSRTLSVSTKLRLFNKMLCQFCFKERPRGHNQAVFTFESPGGKESWKTQVHLEERVGEGDKRIGEGLESTSYSSSRKEEFERPCS